MIDFSTLQGLSVPEGVVMKIEAGGKVLWRKVVAPTPTGIYDDTFPLEWSQLAVSENTANSVTGDGLTLRKVSNCVLTQPMLAGASLTINGIENGETVGTATSTPDICQNIDFGCASMYSNAGIMFASVSTPGEYDGFNFKEAGLYYCWMDTESDTLQEGCDFTFILTLPEAIKIYSGDGFSVYGDWKMPSFPEYDKETYPYVVATRMNLGAYGIYNTMFASTTPRYKQPLADTLTILEAQDYVMAEYIDGAETWGEVKTGTSNSIGDVYQSLNEIIWINYDVYDTVKNDDGTITPTDTVVITASPEAVSLDSKMVVEWTGDTTDLVCDSTATFYKLADTVLKEANFIGGAYATASETVSTITKTL